LQIQVNNIALALKNNESAGSFRPIFESCHVSPVLALSREIKFSQQLLQPGKYACHYSRNCYK